MVTVSKLSSEALHLEFGSGTLKFSSLALNLQFLLLLSVHSNWICHSALVADYVSPRTSTPPEWASVCNMMFL